MLQLRIIVALLGLTAFTRVLAQSSSSASSGNNNATSTTTTATPTSATSVPFFTIPNTFTPPASGSSALPGSVITVTNGPYVSDSFTYTAALSTVPPTGNITNPNVPASKGGAGGSTGLQPDPTNLQTAGAAKRNRIGGGGWTRTDSPTTATATGVALLVLVGTMTGLGLVW
ncbi:hypothetical protein JCM11491_005803 [Sporobolomyces phaffii]